MDDVVVEVDGIAGAVGRVVVTEEYVGAAGGEERKRDAVGREVAGALADTSKSLAIKVVSFSELLQVDGGPGVVLLRLTRSACVRMAEELDEAVRIAKVVRLDLGHVECDSVRAVLCAMGEEDVAAETGGVGVKARL